MKTEHSRATDLVELNQEQLNQVQGGMLQTSFAAFADFDDDWCGTGPKFPIPIPRGGPIWGDVLNLPRFG